MRDRKKPQQTEGQFVTLPHYDFVRITESCAAFADQGLTQWALPHREEGFYSAFRKLYRQSAFGPKNTWLQGLDRELARVSDMGLSPLQSIVESLDLLAVVEDEWDDYVTATLLALRGWTGMIRQMELRGDRFVVPAPPGSLVEFLAVRLILERFALAHVARHGLNYSGPLDALRDLFRNETANSAAPSSEQRAFLVFQIAQLLGWAPPALERMSKQEWAGLAHEIESFSGIERRQIFHLAYERRLRTGALDAIAAHSSRPLKNGDWLRADARKPEETSSREVPAPLFQHAARRPPRREEKPQFQAVFCIDAREESFRRHLEEYAPKAETFGAAGFFSVPMYYRGVADAHFTALCPIVVRPKHWVVEDVVYTFEQLHRRRAKTRRALGRLSIRYIAAAALSARGPCFRPVWESSRRFRWWPEFYFRASRQG